MNNKLAYLCGSKSWGGLEMNHIRNAAWMSKRGHDVVVIGLAKSPFHQAASEQNLRFIPIRTYRKYFDRKGAFELLAILKREAISHLLIRSNYDMSIAASVKRFLKEKLHTSYFIEMQLGVKKTGIHHRLRYRYIDLWSSPLNWLHDQVQELTHFKNELVVIPSGLDLNEFETQLTKSQAREVLELSTNAFLLGLIGRFDQKKGQLLLLNALNKCTNNNVKIVLLGEPTRGEETNYFQEMTRFIEENELNSRVFIRNFRKDISTFYRAVDWVVMASDAETFGMVTIESFACGTPVLGSNSGGTPELLENEEGGTLFESGNSTDLARKIDQISSSKQPSAERLVQIACKYNHNDVCLAVEKALKLS
ncbi:MAG: glycosyltransferase [Crocinitomicaceae bacterium]|jgi:glycosyltransferase involved in cell wall biosynthesis|nr:glycosyltransferase [Crocinitomicaceae bacterium]MDG1659319.1 glycosyltransferase [Crocinitomicaceae bacterium]